jgi:hypothetical protein
MLLVRLARYLLGWLVWYLWARSLLWVRAFLPPFLPRDLPSPLRKRYAEGIEWMAIGFVGGIESIVIDGRRWFFGFDYRGDTVISPLIGDPDMMAAFASRYMLQRDGVHGREYWRARVEESIGSKDPSRGHQVTLPNDTCVSLSITILQPSKRTAAGGYSQRSRSNAASQTARGSRRWSGSKARELTFLRRR